MALMANQVEQLVRLGANVQIPEGHNYMSTQIEQIIRVAAGTGAHVSIHRGRFMSTQLEQFARIGRNSVTIIV